MDEQMNVLLGGERIDVTVRGLEGDTTESVLVRELPIRLIPLYGQIVDRDDLAIEMYCEKPKGWSDQLSLESAEKVLEIGERLNWDFFLRWLERQTRRRKKLDPEFEQKALAIVKEATKEALQQNLSQQPAQTSASN